MKVLAAPVILLAGVVGIARPAAADVTVTMPADVQSFLDRADSCAHWAGEEAYDQMRARQIERSETQLKCDQLDHDGRALRVRHGGDPEVMKALDSALAEFD